MLTKLLHDKEIMMLWILSSHFQLPNNKVAGTKESWRQSNSHTCLDTVK